MILNQILCSKSFITSVLKVVLLVMLLLETATPSSLHSNTQLSIYSTHTLPFHTFCVYRITSHALQTMLSTSLTLLDATK
jgi:hypothetical protein